MEKITAFIYFLLPKHKSKKPAYCIYFWLMQIAAWGMLITFSIKGYFLWSIIFSTLAQFVFYFFSIIFIKDISKEQNISKTVKYFAISSVILFIISSLGPYFLAYFSIKGPSTPLVTRGALYYYLHFQYNGWFTFALFLHWLKQKNIVHYTKNHKYIYFLLTIGIIPGYALSLIGYLKDAWVYICAYFAVLTQLIALFLFLKEIWIHNKRISSKLNTLQKAFWGIAFLSFVAKTVLQAFSLNPNLALVAFSLRPLVIGYLHLIFLCMLSFFMIAYLLNMQQISIHKNKLSKIGLWAFFFLSILSEILLFLQAYAYYFSIRMVFIPKWLLFVTLFMVLSYLLFLIFIKGKKDKSISA
ncbi:MAG TPA: hypothetical protein VK027_08080 [Chitinophagaceae bacterium]|nr:hypothetical protein [Chitinophagaceae bacterium]